MAESIEDQLVSYLKDAHALEQMSLQMTEADEEPEREEEEEPPRKPGRRPVRRRSPAGGRNRR
jgi:hypothetical protein